VTTTDRLGNLHAASDGRFQEKSNSRPSATVPPSRELLEAPALTAREYPIIIASSLREGPHRGEAIIRRYAKVPGLTDEQAIDRAIADFADSYPDETLDDIEFDRAGGPAETVDADTAGPEPSGARKREWLGTIGAESMSDDEFDLVLHRLAGHTGSVAEKLDEVFADEPTWTLEGDDHETRTVRAATLAEAREEVALGFYDQYAEDYEGEDGDEVVRRIGDSLELIGFLDEED